MKNIVIFAGTTEGRQLAESFAAADIPVTVCVATEYGREVMTPDHNVTVHSGRMDADEMLKFLHSCGTEIVYDATHPYAVEASRNIKTACKACDITYKRIERPASPQVHNYSFKEIHVKNTQEAARELRKHSGPILLTTGSKELHDFRDFRDRMFVRVLPSPEAISICEECCIKKSHIIAQQGPFTYEENLALMDRYDIGVLVTKDSGVNGGYNEKLNAAKTAGATVIVIDKPDEEAYHTGKRHVTLSVIGAGCGEDTLTIEAARAIRSADLIIGTRRLLDYKIVQNNYCTKYETYKVDDIMNVVDLAVGNVVVLYSGDTGFYSGAEALLKAVPADVDVKVYPGISSIAALSARTRIPYDHAAIKSYHGIAIDEDELRQTVSQNPVTYLLLSGREDAERACEMFPDKRIFVAVDMGTDHEELCEIGDESPFDIYGKLYTLVIVR